MPLAREPSRPEEGLTRVKEHLVAVADFFIRPAHLGLAPVESVDLETLEAAQVSGCGENVRQWVGSTGRIPPHPMPLQPCPSLTWRPIRQASGELHRHQGRPERQEQPGHDSVLPGTTTGRLSPAGIPCNTFGTLPLTEAPGEELESTFPPPWLPGGWLLLAREARGGGWGVGDGGQPALQAGRVPL